MFAIIKTGGKQISVKVGDEIYIEKLSNEEGEKVNFNEVLMIDGTIGTPLIKGAVVVGTIVKQGKEKKLRVVRYHPKKNVNKVYGHRQPYTKVKIETISASGAKMIESSEKKPTTPMVKPSGEVKSTSTAIKATPTTTKSTVATKPSTTTKPKPTSTAKPKVVAKPKLTEDKGE